MPNYRQQLSGSLGTVNACPSCGGGGTLTPFYSTSGVYAQKEFVCDFVAAFTLLYHDGTDTLPSVGDTIYAGSTTGSQTVSWSNHKGFNEVEGDNSTVSGTTNAQGVIASTWQCQ
jgi:hypothetical protein